MSYGARKRRLMPLCVRTREDFLGSGAGSPDRVR
jgi:hypothetical protein